MAKDQSRAKLNIGTGGSPLTSKSRAITDGIARAIELGLNHLELEFVYSVYFDLKTAEQVRTQLAGRDFTLTCHGSYFTNFAAQDKQKWHASVERLVKASRVADAAGAKSITFHAGFFTGQTEEQVQPMVIEGLLATLEKLPETKIILAPEVTGKASQYGDLPELIRLVKQMHDRGLGDRVAFCVDFAHLHARHTGKYAAKDEIKQVFDLIIDELGHAPLQQMHMHMSALEYSAKGERNHLTFLPSFQAYVDQGINIPEMESYFDELKAKNRLGGGQQDWQGLLALLKEYNVGGYLVCESPVLELDALLMQQVYNGL